MKTQKLKLNIDESSFGTDNETKYISWQGGDWALRGEIGGCFSVEFNIWRHPISSLLDLQSSSPLSRLLLCNGGPHLIFERGPLDPGACETLVPAWPWCTWGPSACGPKAKVLLTLLTLTDMSWYASSNLPFRCLDFLHRQNIQLNVSTQKNTILPAKSTIVHPICAILTFNLKFLHVACVTNMRYAAAYLFHRRSQKAKSCF